MKKLLSVIMAVAVLVSCQSKTSTNEKVAENQVNEEVVYLALNDFGDKAETLVGKQIELNGTIDHVCKHGGQKMFIVNQDSDARIKITTGENMAAFNTDLEGENVKVLGVVDELRIDEDYLREWEEELKNEEHSEAGDQVHMGEGEGESGDDHHEAEHSGQYDQINEYREMIKASGKDYISFFSVVCVEYEVIDGGA